MSLEGANSLRSSCGPGSRIFARWRSLVRDTKPDLRRPSEVAGVLQATG